jgi:peptide-methionine (R)-S-oxide reductase
MKTMDVEALRRRLTPLQFDVTQNAATERPFTGAYWDKRDAGSYRCVVCGDVLFTSTEKFDAHCGWPSFYDVVDKAKVIARPDNTLGMRRTEVLCANCGAHLATSSTTVQSRPACGTASTRPRSTSWQGPRSSSPLGSREPCGRLRWSGSPATPRLPK